MRARVVELVFTLLGLIALSAASMALSDSLRSAPSDCSFSAHYPPQYVAYKSHGRPRLDGRLDEPFWDDVEWTGDFVDISTTTTPRFNTKAKIRYDDEYLYVGALLEEPQVWATLTEHDTVVYQDNDFEVFVNSDGTTHFYKEFEMNAFNTTWDLCLNRPYLNGGYENSSRVFGDHGFDEPGTRCGVHVDGAINDPAKGSKSWSVEIAFPLATLALNATRATVPPRRGQYWRVNFSRVEWRVNVEHNRYVKVPKVPEDNWVWAPIGIIDIHLPEKWGYVQFSDLAPGKDAPVSDPEYPSRFLAMQLYYALTAYYAKHAEYTDKLDELLGLVPVRGSLSCGKLIDVTLRDGGQRFVASAIGSKSEKFLAQVDETRFLSVLAL